MPSIPWKSAAIAVDVINDQYNKTIFMFGDGDFVASIRKVGKVTYVVFRGSADVSDWYRNVQFDQVKHPWGRVHGGVYNSIQKNLDSFLTELKPQYFDSYVFCGHSAGGAYAQLIAAEMLLMGAISPSCISVVTFGSQRVGDRDFKKCIESKLPEHFAFVHESDPVPGLPRSSSWFSFLSPLQRILQWKHRYKETGNLVWYDGSMWKQKKNPWDSFVTYLTHRKGLILGDFLQDHKFTNYYHEVKRAGSSH